MSAPLSTGSPKRSGFGAQLQPQPNLRPALWQQLQVAARCLEALRAGRSLNEVLPSLDATERPAAQALCFAALRHWGQAQAVRDGLVRRRPQGMADALLCLSLALLLQDPPLYPAHTLVTQAVEAAKRGFSESGTAAVHARGARSSSKAAASAASFLNACLRRFLREREALLALSLSRHPLPKTQREGVPLAVTPGLAAAWANHPHWWLDHLQKDHPESWANILQAGQSKPPMSLRVNLHRHSLSDYQALLQAQGIASHACAPAALRLDEAQPVQTLPGFDQAWVSVQDLAAQWAAPLLMEAVQAQTRGASKPDGRSVWRVLDACAAPGGKTMHLIEWAQSHGQALELWALDLNESRLRRVRENVLRLQGPAGAHKPSNIHAQELSLRFSEPDISVHLRCADAAEPAAWWDGQAFDAILLDAPCSASGIVRRHPDIPWLRREADLQHLAQTQDRLLANLWGLLSPLGHLLYCTCSVFKQEGQERIQSFLKRNIQAHLCASPGHVLPQIAQDVRKISDNRSSDCDHDGFYYALLQKTT